MTRLTRSLMKAAVCGAGITALTGCSLFPTFNGDRLSPEDQARFLRDGVISISRPAPSVRQLGADTMLSFLPVTPKPSGKWVKIDRSAGTISLMERNGEVLTVSAEGLKDLDAGRYEVMHKQRRAPWHAPDQYFVSRKLDVPAAGSRDRFLRGALGEFSLFLNDQIPVHSGPIWTADIGGIQVDEQALSKIYYSIKIGGTVEVQ